MKNRKFIVFCISIAAIIFLSWFDKEGTSQVVALATALFAANCAQKFTNTNTIGDR